LQSTPSQVPFRRARALTITCCDCGTTQSVPLLPPRAVARCYVCDRVLDRHGRGFHITLACSAAILLLLPPSFFLPLMESSFRNLLYEGSRLVSSVGVIYREVWFPFAFGFLFFAFVFPALRALLLVLVLGHAHWRWPIPQAGRLFRFAQELRVWSMPDVVLIAGIVAYYRAEIPAEVSVRIGAWCYALVGVLAIIATRTLDVRGVWNAILADPEGIPEGPIVSCSICEMTVVARRAGDPCPRCGGTLERDAARRFAPALGAIAAAIPLCLPAYAASVMINDQLTAVLEHTVIGTVQMLADRGYWQLGAVVLIAGVGIPTVVLVGMTWLLVRVRFPNRHGLVLRTRIYRVIHRLVRWPMIIPFIAALAAPIVDFRGIDDIVAGPGATPLFMVIALSMLGVRLFEPRLMWKTTREMA
jgi:paraquat-inducible protein A